VRHGAQHFAASLVADFTKPYGETVDQILKDERGGCYETRPGNGMSLSDIRNVPPEVATQDVVAGKPLPEITDKVPGH
jgi:hypothetical protein